MKSIVLLDDLRPFEPVPAKDEVFIYLNDVRASARDSVAMIRITRNYRISSC